MIVTSGTSTNGSALLRGWCTMPSELRLQRAGLTLQCLDRGAVNFGGQFEFAAGGRPSANHEQDGRDHEIGGAENRCRGNRAPDLHQREIGRQFQHQQAEGRDQCGKRPQAQSDQHVPHPDFRDDAVGAPQRAQMLDDVLAVHVNASSA
jgi:hypothetical protein